MLSWPLAPARRAGDAHHHMVVRDQLAAKSITHLLPLWRKRSIQKDRVKFVEVPLFGCYLFGYFSLHDRVAVLETVGVARLVGINGTPGPVPEAHIAVVRTRVAQHLPSDPHPSLAEGLRVRITRGVLVGAADILIAQQHKHPLVRGARQRA